MHLTSLSKYLQKRRIVSDVAFVVHFFLMNQPMTISLVYDSSTFYIKKMLLYSKENEKSSDSVFEILNVNSRGTNKEYKLMKAHSSMVRKLKVFPSFDRHTESK